MEKKIILDDYEYNLVKNYKDGFQLELIQEKYTDYFEPFDYIFGDFSYDKLRLKGFYEHDNSTVKEINDINNLENYISDYCSFDCRYFLLKKSKKVNKNS